MFGRDHVGASPVKGWLGRSQRERGQEELELEEMWRSAQALAQLGVAVQLVTSDRASPEKLG